MTNRHGLRNRCLATLLGVCGVFGMDAAIAHGSMKPLHGGVVTMVGGEVTFELVGKPEGAEVYVIDDGDDIVASDFTGRITVLHDGKTQEAALAPAGGNRLTAAGVALPAGARVIVAITRTATGSKLTARFALH